MLRGEPVERCTLLGNRCSSREKDRKDRWRNHKEMEADLDKEKEGKKKTVSLRG